MPPLFEDGQISLILNATDSQQPTNGTTVHAFHCLWLPSLVDLCVDQRAAPGHSTSASEPMRMPRFSSLTATTRPQVSPKRGLTEREPQLSDRKMLGMNRRVSFGEASAGCSYHHVGHFDLGPVTQLKKRRPAQQEAKIGDSMEIVVVP